MATQSTATANPVAGNEKPANPTPQPPPPPPPPPSPAPVMVKPIEGDNKDSQNSGEEAATEAFKRSISAALEQPMREEQVQNAVKFLSHPKVRGSPVMYRRSFLEKKGLTREEIDEAFRRVPDPPSNVASVEAASPTQGSTPKPPASLQPQPPTQNTQTAVVPSNVRPTAPALQKPRFHWSHGLLGVGVVCCSGAGIALLFKNAILPRLKTWIRKVAKEEDDAEKKDKLEQSLAKEAAEAAKTAASAAAVVAQSCQDLLSANNEEKKYYEAFMGLLDAQVKEMKSMGSSIRNLEATREVTHPQEKQIADIQSASENGPINNIPMIPLVDQSDPRIFSTSSQERKMNGTVNTTVRPSSAPASVEPTAAAYPKSFVEIMAMVQRGETPPGIKEINDMPPNPNQPPSNPRLVPRTKPWEVAKQVQQNSYGQSQGRVDGSLTEVQDNGQSSQLNGKPSDDSGRWRKQNTPVITEIENEVEEPKLSSYGIGSKNWPGRGWVPPQTPSVAVPEAAAAIRKPKPSVQKQQAVMDSTIQPRDREDEMAGASNSKIGAGSSCDGVVDLYHGNDMQEEGGKEGKLLLELSHGKLLNKFSKILTVNRERVDGSLTEVQDNEQSSQLNSRPFDGSDPWRKQKTPIITEIENEVEEPKLSSYGIGSKNWPGTDWAPPQTPSVAVPEAAATIRNPTPSIQKQQVVMDSTRQPSDREGETAGTSNSAFGAGISSDGLVNPSHENEIQEEPVDGVSVH